MTSDAQPNDFSGVVPGSLHAWSRVLTRAEADAFEERTRRWLAGETVEPCGCDLCAGRMIAVDAPNTARFTGEPNQVIMPGESVTVGPFVLP